MDKFSNDSLVYNIIYRNIRYFHIFSKTIKLLSSIIKYILEMALWRVLDISDMRMNAEKELKKFKNFYSVNGITARWRAVFIRRSSSDFVRSLRHMSGAI